MKKIKTKPADTKPRMLEDVKRMPHTAMQKAWLASKEKAASGIRDTVSRDSRDDSMNTPVNNAGDQVVESARSVLQDGKDLALDGGKQLQKTVGRTAQRRNFTPRPERKFAAADAERLPAAKIGTKSKRKSSLPKEKTSAITTVRRSAKTAQTSRTATQNTATAAQKTGKAAPSAAQKMAQAVRTGTQTAAKGAKALLNAVTEAVKATVAAAKSLGAAIAAGGWVAVVIVLLICLIGFVAGSCYGIFFSTETDEGISVAQAVEQLNGEYEERLKEIECTVPHDRLETISNDGDLSIHWPEVLSVFAAYVSGAEDGEPVMVLDAALLEKLKNIFWQMNDVQYATRTETHEEEVTTIDNNGNEVTTIQTVSEVILTISITHKTAAEMAQKYHFSSRQKEYLKLMLQPENQEMWEFLIPPIAFVKLVYGNFISEDDSVHGIH